MIQHEFRMPPPNSTLEVQRGVVEEINLTPFVINQIQCINVQTDGVNMFSKCTMKVLRSSLALIFIHYSKKTSVVTITLQISQCLTSHVVFPCISLYIRHIEKCSKHKTIKSIKVHIYVKSDHLKK